MIYYSPTMLQSLSKLRLGDSRHATAERRQKLLVDMREFRNVVAAEPSLSPGKPRSKGRCRSVGVHCFRFWYTPASELLGTSCTLLFGLMTLFIVAPVVLLFNGDDARSMCILINRAPECSCRCYTACFEASTGQFSPYNTFATGTKSLYSYHPSACAADFAGVTLLRGGIFNRSADGHGNGGGVNNPCGVCPCGMERCVQLYNMCAYKLRVEGSGDLPADCMSEFDISLPPGVNPYACHKPECSNNPCAADYSKALPLDSSKWAALAPDSCTRPGGHVPPQTMDSECGRLADYAKTRKATCGHMT